MKSSTAAAVLVAFSLATVTNAVPTRRDVSDPQVLNFALTLEHLESTFYQQGLAHFSQSDFVAAGFPDWVYGRFEQIRDHEATHVKFLSTALTLAGAQAVAPCQYNFHFTDVHSFVDTSVVLEAVGTTAYTGGAQLIASKEYLTAAASILAVEARHEAWINSAAEGHSAWDTGFQTALTPIQVYSLASSFITSCPAANAKSLPALAPYPALTVSAARPGSTATLTFADPNASTQLFAVFISGIAAPVFVPIQNGNQVVIPRDLLGFVFCVITTKNGGVLDDSTVAGPAILKFPFDSRGQLV
ncbi:ferritin-like domain-containing protein [Mycena galopus ATCC 62051]|nr:ferritin-like domain-containing protein [Mycena galopus ATCC 62051]